MKKFLLSLIILLSSFWSTAQLDVKHYIPQLYGRVNVQNHYIILSTPSTTPVTVTVTRGNGVLITTTVITDLAPATILLGSGYAAPGIIGTAELNIPNAADGFIVDATAPIYVNLRHVQNWQGLSLTSKGAATGLGTRFRSGHIFSSAALPFVKAHEISVMATEDNTTVLFSDISPNVIFRNTPVTAGTSDDISVVLMAGESYTIAAWVDEPGAIGNVNDVNGTLITSDKPIAVNTGSWLSGAWNNTRDIGVDQIVPVSLIGSEYIFIEGDGVPLTERPLIVAEYDNTSIFVNGNAVPVATINAGDYLYLPQTSYSANDNIYIQTSQPIFMYQSLSGGSPAATCLNFIPPLRCNGFKKVVIPSVNLVGVATVSITARTNASVWINGSTTALTGGLTVPGNSCWLTYKIPGGTGDFIVESDSIINVALLTLQGPRGSAGYFTGFAQFNQIDQGDTSSFIVCVDSASSFVTYSIEGPYFNITTNFYDPALNGQVIIDGFNGDSLFFTYIGDPNTISADTLDISICKLLDCCGAIPDTICEVTTLVFTNIVDIQTGIGDSIYACVDTSDITLEDLIIGTFDPSGYWVDTDNSGALFGNTFQPSVVPPGTYNFTYYIDGGSICFDSTVVTITVLPMSASECCSIDPVYALADPTCFGFTNGSILITDIWATDYSIDGGTTTQPAGSFINIGANLYNVNLSFGPDCLYDTIITITEPAILAATFILDSVSCFGACDGQIVANTTGGTTPYNYSLGGMPAVTTNTFSNLCAGPATITLMDSNNCTIVYPNTILEPAVLTLSELTNMDETCTVSNGSLSVLTVGGTASYSYTLNAGIPQSSPFFTGLSAGIYTVEVTDFNGCTASINITIIDNPPPIPFVDVINAVTCAGGLNGSVTIGVNFGTAPFQFSLNLGPNQASNNFSAVGAGNHSVTVTDVNGCTGIVNFIITQPSPLTYSTVVTNASCFDVCDGTITISASGAIAPYSYSDDNGLTFQLSSTLTGLCDGNINVVVKDDNGCLANSVVPITEPTAVSSIQGLVDPLCYQTPTGEISFAPSGGTPGYTFSTNGIAFSASSPITNLMAGVYDIVIQDANGCQFLDQVTLTDPAPFTFNFVGNNPSNCGANDGSFEILATSGTAPYLYSIDGGVTQQLSNGFFNNLFSGLYNLTVEDDNGCIDSVFSALSDNVMVTQTDLTFDVTCYGGFDGIGTVSQSLGAPPFTYTINTSAFPQPGGVFGGLSAGVYFVTVEDAGLCIGIEQFEIFQPDSITFTNPVVDITCPNGLDGQIDFAGVIGGDNGPYTYSIDGGATYFATSLFTGLTSGTYTVFAMDGNGCLGSTQATLIEPIPWDVVINETDLTCFQNNTGFIQIIGGGSTGPYTYDLNGTPSVSGIYTALAANTYPITVTDVNNCTFNTPQVVNEPVLLTATYVNANTLCFGSSDGTVDVTGNGGTPPYLYSSDNGTILQSSNILVGLSLGCYDVYVVDDNGCTVVSNECITQPTEITMALVTNPVTCGLDADVAITAANGTPTYLYSVDGGATFQAGNGFAFLAASNYVIVIQDQNLCEVDSLITITADPEPVIDNVAFTNPLCFGSTDGTLTITSSSGIGIHQYSITSAVGPFQVSNLFTGLVGGNYTIFVQDANGCVTTSAVVLTQPSIIVINSVPTDLTCFQNSTGVVDITGSAGGTSPYTYSVDNGVTFQGIGFFPGLNATSYDLVVEDANGCQITGVQVVNEPTQVIFNPFTINATSCYAVCDGIVTANVFGGTVLGLYTYNWSGGIANSSSDVATNVCAGTYSLIVEDDNGCQNDTLNFVVAEPNQAIIDSVVTNPVMCAGDANGWLEIYSANAGLYSIPGFGFTTTTNYSNLPTGLYWTYVQDVNGCVGDSLEVFIATPQPLNGFVTPDVFICQGDTIFFSVIGTGGTNPYVFSINSGLSSNAIIEETILSDTMYYVNITDANGCTFDTDTMFITVAPPPLLNTVNDTIICHGQPVTVSSEAIDLVETYTYLWNTGETTPFIYPNVQSDTTYYVTVTDECNVSTIDSVAVTLFPDPIVSIIPDITGGCPPFQINYTITVNIADLGSDLFWSTGFGTIDSSNFNNLYITYNGVGSGDINLTFTSSDGCTVDTTYSNLVQVFELPIADFIISPDSPTIYDANIDVINTSSDYDTNEWFVLGDTITTTNMILDLSQLPSDSAITICLVVENANGCTDTICKPISIENELFLFVPNAIILDGFSPNSIFKPVTNYFHPDWYQLYIFNRWGEKIFSTTDVNQGWDGTYQDKIVQDGVYVWKIVGAPLNNEADLREYTGHVTVLK